VTILSSCSLFFRLLFEDNHFITLYMIQDFPGTFAQLIAGASYRDPQCRPASANKTWSNSTVAPVSGIQFWMRTQTIFVTLNCLPAMLRLRTCFLWILYYRIRSANIGRCVEQKSTLHIFSLNISPEKH